MEVRLGGAAAGVPARAYASVLQQVTFALEEIDRITHPMRATRPAWSVTRTDWTASSGPVVILTPDADPRRRSEEDISRPARALVDGVLTLSEVPEIPDGFSEGVIERIGNVRRQVDGRHRGLQAVTLISVNGARSIPAEVSEAVDRNARAAVTGTSYAYGSLVGTLDVISARRHKRRIGLLPDYGPAVSCNVDKLADDVVVGFFNKRVIVGGLLRRNSRGQVVRLDADHLELVPGLSPVRAADLIGALPDLGDGLSVSEYLARQRAR
ncbi:hypothetical protein [Kineococcus rubinsiae]|uniref:hypothetical protein n=1 Tax=Kineococcus rubinsiae TaxID=2609562 RepID=UPI001431CCAD|nr:hypothetical protein [Kineococcus rubinsiae]NIZ90327.1 hypothetical protein [Kineococcus rubinsiae]